MTKVLVPLADGVEEMEAVIIIDTLRRAKWDVVSAGIREGEVVASRRVRLVPDCSWDEIDLSSFDMIVLPGGGGGTENLCKDERVLDAIRRFHREGKWVAAVCAGPLVLQEAGVLGGRKATCHPGVAEQLTTTERVEERVVTDGRIVTSQGPGTSFEFALALIAHVDGEETADAIAKAMVLPGRDA